MRALLLLGSAFLTLALAAPASAGFYECKDGNGRVMFQDRPCADGHESTERDEPKAGITRAAPEPQPAALGEAPPAPERPLTTRIAAPARVPADQRYVVDRSEIDGEAWQEMLAAARETHSHGTLVRVFLEHAIESDLIQAQASKISNPERSDGGGRYREFPSGTFLLIEHTGESTGTGRESLEVGNTRHGVSTIWLPVAANDTVAIGGDIVLGRMAMSQRGQIEVRLPPGYRTGPLAVGPLVVGGRYGDEHECDNNGVCRAGDLAPGPYKLQFPKIDAKRARFDATVEPGRRLILDFRPGSSKQIMIVERRVTSLAAKSD
jgi:hypothetical protein